MKEETEDIRSEIEELYYKQNEYDRLPVVVRSNVSERVYNNLIDKKEYFDWLFGVDYL